MPNLRKKRTIALVLIGVFFIPLSVFADYVSKPNVTGAYEDNAVWEPDTYGNIYPTTNGIIDKIMIISSGAVITRTGELINHATINVNGKLIITSNYNDQGSWNGLITNNGGEVLVQGSASIYQLMEAKTNSLITINGSINLNGGTGLIVRSGAKVEVFGDLSGSAGVVVENGGVLIIHGNFTSTGSGVTINGDLLVMGDYSSSSSTVLDVNGNLVVGGDFSHLGGGFSGTTSENLYILDPDAVLTGPEDWGPIFDTNYGDLEDLIANESDNPELLTALEVLLPGLVPFTWVGTVDTDWFNPDNWNRKSIPVSTSNVVINTESNLPQINPGVDVIAQTGKLTLKSGASLTVNPGGKLTVNGNLTIESGSSLVLVNETGSDKLASLITKGAVSGSANIKLKLPASQWYYISSAIANATFGNFDAGEIAGSSVYVFRNAQWFSTNTDHTTTLLNNLEGVLVKYPIEHTLDYSGIINSGTIQNTSLPTGWYLFGNPYPSSINWEDNAGWSRENIDGTFWYRTRVGGVMTFVTYNRWAATGAKAALFPDATSWGNESDLANIPPMQSVWIKVYSEGTTLSVNNEARTHGETGSYLKSNSANSEADVIRIVSNNDVSRDGAVIYFAGQSTDAMDRGDSEKRFNDSEQIPEVYTRIGTTAAAINGLPELTSTSRSIPLSVRNRVEGDVTLSFDLSLFQSGHSVELEDKVTGTRTKLRATADYTYTPAVMGEVHDRFVLHINQVTTSVVDPEATTLDNGITIAGIHGRAVVNIPSQMLSTTDATIEVYTLEGQKVSETTTTVSQTVVNLPKTDALFLVRVTAGSETKTSKVLVKTN